MSHPFIPVNYTCMPYTNSLFVQINSAERGFPAQFLITQWWPLFPELQTALYTLGGIQMFLAIVGILMSASAHVPIKGDSGWEKYAFHKILPFLTCLWQLFLSFLLILLPTQWLSNVTMGMILFHSWAEFFGLIMRFLIVKEKLSPHNLTQYFKWVILGIIITGVPFLLVSNPFVQGIITAFPVLPADFLNLLIAPILAVKSTRTVFITPAEKAAEYLSAFLYVVHVIWFYGQGIISCAVDVNTGAKYFISLQVISTATFFGFMIAHAVALYHDKNQFRNPIHHFWAFILCCQPPMEDFEKAPSNPNVISASFSDASSV